MQSDAVRMQLGVQELGGRSTSPMTTVSVPHGWDPAPQEGLKAVKLALQILWD